jgi:hypothetical protein
MNIYKASGATIVRGSASRYIRLIGYVNPEIIFPSMIQEYFTETGYSQMYPYFRTLRIGAVHPFAMLLFQEISGSTLDVNLFPSITIADTSDSETYDTLGRDRDDFMLGAEEVERLKYGVSTGSILTSDGNILMLENATKNGNKIYGTKSTYRSNHNIDMNIWGDNKDMISMIYDMLKHFIVAKRDTLREYGISIEGSVNGRRSGDINVEFGKLLYGANVTVPAIIETSSMVMDVSTEDIARINSTAEYSLTGGA